MNNFCLHDHNQIKTISEKEKTDNNYTKEILSNIVEESNEWFDLKISLYMMCIKIFHPLAKQPFIQLIIKFKIQKKLVKIQKKLDRNFTIGKNVIFLD